MKNKHWTQEDIKKARKLVDAKASDEECIAAVGRKYWSCYMKIARDRYGKSDVRVEAAPIIPPTVIEEAVKRMAAPRDLTGVICGDPPKGYSALERRA
jgi:hypothetical protein